MRFAERARLVAEHPDVCSVPRRFDSHLKVLVRFPNADPALVTSALQSAWNHQRATP